MTTRNLTLTSVVAGALLIVALALMAGLGNLLPAAAQAQTQPTPPRQITVIGSGDITGRPDMATVQIGVETNAPSTQAALTQNNTQVAALISKLKALGVADKDIQTSDFNIYPTYDKDGRQITGYSVSNTVRVAIRNLDQAGELLDAVVEAGANRVYGISFSVADPAALIAQARARAMADAKVRAEQLAQGGGARVGQVLVIQENAGVLPVPLPMAQGRADEAAASVPVEVGEQSFNVQVQVTYELR